AQRKLGALGHDRDQGPGDGTPFKVDQEMIGGKMLLSADGSLGTIKPQLYFVWRKRGNRRSTRSLHFAHLGPVILLHLSSQLSSQHLQLALPLWQRRRNKSLFLFEATTHSLINKETVIFYDKDSVS